MSEVVDSKPEDQLFAIDVKGNIIKKEKDCTVIMNNGLVKVQQILREGGEHVVNNSLEILLETEKRCRLSGDCACTTRLMIAMAELCYSRQDYDALDRIMRLLPKRRGQFKDALQAFIRACSKFADQINDIDDQLKILKSITDISLGKVYVENERARAVRKIANIQESIGKPNDAMSSLKDLHVESYLTMDPKEKADFQVEQLRLFFEQKNITLAEVVANKIEPSTFVDCHELTSKYHLLMANLKNYFKQYLEVARHYKALLESPTVERNTDIWKEAARGVIVLLLMAGLSNEQELEIRKMKKIKNLDDVDPYEFSQFELIDIDWIKDVFYEKFIHDLSGLVCSFNPENSSGIENWNIFLDRISEYNVKIISNHYKTMRMSTMAKRLKISVDDVEKHICTLVNQDTIYAKIDQPTGIVTFVEKENDNIIIKDFYERMCELVFDMDVLNDMIVKEIKILSSENS